METNLAFAAKRLAMNLSRRGSKIVVVWGAHVGGTPDPVTGAMVGGTDTLLSGTLRGFTYDVEARVELRRYREIRAGDKLVDLPPEGLVTPFDGSAAVALDALESPRFVVDGEWFMQGQVGEELAGKWRLLLGDKPVLRTVLLRPST